MSGFSANQRAMLDPSTQRGYYDYRASWLAHRNARRAPPGGPRARRGLLLTTRLILILIWLQSKRRGCIGIGGRVLLWYESTAFGAYCKQWQAMRAGERRGEHGKLSIIGAVVLAAWLERCRAAAHMLT